MHPTSTDLPPVHTCKVDGHAEAFPALANQTLFQAMSQAGVPWPVSCRNGTCRTCLGRLIHGRVAYDIPWPGLSADEKREGCCLPCVARPEGDCVIERP